MAKIREEIVGKRFLSVSSGSKLKLSKINEWDWRAGVIRACTHADSKHHDLQVLVEYDDVEWQRREWVHVYRGQVFQIFLLERTLAWASRKHPSKIRAPPVLWPALVYMPLVDQAGISEHKYRPVEYLVDRSLDYHDYSQVQPYQDGDMTGVYGEECMRAVRAWVGEQDGQRILLTTPSVLVGFRVQVYRSEGTTQWYTAVIVGYNDATRELTVTDDTVLEEHSEDPSLVQIRLIGEGVVESILRGENVGITPRRSRTATNNHHQSGVRHIRRDGVVPARGRKNSLTRPNNLPPTASHTLPPNTTHSHLPVAIHSLTPKTSAATPSHLNSSSPSSSSVSRGEDLSEAQHKDEIFQSHALKGQHLKHVAKNNSSSSDAEKEVNEENQDKDEKSEEDLDKDNRKSSLSSPSISPLQSNSDKPSLHPKETTPLQTIKEKPLLQIKEKPPEHEAEQQVNKQIKEEASQQPTEKNFQKVKDNFSQEIKEEPLRQIKEKPPEHVHLLGEGKEKEKDKISTKKVVNENKGRKIKEQNPQQVKVLLTRHSRNQLRDSIKEPLLNSPKKSNLQNHEEILEIFQERDSWQKKKLITRQTKEILTRQAKEQLSRQTKVLLTRPLKDQLPKEYRKELAKREKINRSLKGSDQDSPKVQLVKIDESLSSSASRKNSKEDNYSPQVKEEVDKEENPPHHQVLGSERVEKEAAFPTKRKETLQEIKDPTHPPKKGESFHSKKDSKTKTPKDRHKKENREDTKYSIKEEKCYSIASDPLLLKIIKEEASCNRPLSSSSSSVASSCASSPLPSQQSEETEQPPPQPNKKDTSRRTPKEEHSHKKEDVKDDDDEGEEEVDNNIKGKSVAVGVRWKKRCQGSITSETSSGDEEHRPVRERRSLRATPDSVSRVLTRLEKQNSVEKAKNTSGSNSSSSSSTPDHRPVRRTNKNSRVQNLHNLGDIEAKDDVDSIGSSTDSSISKINKSDTNFSGSNNCSSSITSASSTSTSSSSSTPEPELRSRPPSQRVAALRHQKLISHRLRGNKRGKNRGFQRSKQRWRSVSPVTSTESSTEINLTQRSPKNKNNDENINSTNCEDSSTKSQKRKYTTPSKLSGRNDHCNSSREVLHDIKDPLVEKSQHCPNTENPKDTASVSDSESAEDPIVVVYEKTNFKNRTPVIKSENETRIPTTRRVSVNVSKPVVSADNDEISSRLISNSTTVEQDLQSRTSLPSTRCDENGKSLDAAKKDSLSNSTNSIVPSVTDNNLLGHCVPKNSLFENKSSSASEKSVHVSESESDDGNSRPLVDISNSSNQDNLSQSSFQNSGPFKAKSPPRTLISDALISSDEGPDDEVKRKLVTSVDLIVESLRDESESESYNQSDKDLFVKSTLNSSPNLQTSTTLDLDSLPCTCVCNTSSVSDSIITTTSVVRKHSVSEDVDQQNVSVLQGTDDSISVISSHYNTSEKSAGSSRDVNSAVVSSTTAVSGSVNTVSIVTSVTSANSESVVPGTTSAIVSPSQAVGIGKSLDSRVSINNNSGSGCKSNISCSINSSSYTNRDCVEVAGVVSGRAVTITATSGPGPTSSTRVASPPSVSITAVVRSPAAHLQPANPDPAYPAPHHHDGVPHTSLHHQLQPANSHPHHHHQHYQQIQQHQSQQQLNTASATTRMDHCDGSSDSGVSVTERSVSRSSVLSDDRSSSAEVKPNTPTPITASQIKTSQAALLLDRKEPIRVYRDPSLLSQSEHTVRHIHSVQHTSMSQHYPGVPPLHHAPPTGTPGSGGSHGPGHHGSHGQPPSSLPHGLPPGLHYPAHPAAAAAGVPPPMHLPPGLQQPLPPGLYPHDVWKLGPVPGIPQHAYAGLLAPHQEELMHLERAREMDRERAERDRILRREAEAREKERAAKEKMERERNERERREREERERREKERREREEKERQQYQVDQHFNKSFRLAQQKHGGENVRQMPADHLNQAYYVHGLPNHHPSNHPSHNHSLLMTQHTKAYQAQAHVQKATAGWNPLGGLVKPDRGMDAMEERRLFEQRQEDAIRRVHEPEKMVHESIHKAFRTMDRSNDPQGKMRHPPPAHASSKPQSDKAVVSAGLPKIAEPSFNLSYPPNYLAKDTKLTHSAERVPYPHYPDPRDKASVIIQPEKYERGPPHSMSPKQRPPERSSPYPPGSAYKTHDPSSSLHRSSTSHHPSSLPHNIETKPRQPQSSPLSTPSPAHADRYYTPPGAKPPPTTYPSSLITAGLVPNPLHVSSVTAKTKVSSPPPQLYGKPGITTGTPVCRVDSRPSQPIPLTSKATVGGPPPAHSGRGSHGETRPPMPSHEQRTSLERGPYDARIYPPTVPSPHHKHVVAPGPPPARIPPVSSPHIATPHIPPHPSPQPTQTQPLDLGTREDTASPSKRRTQTPTPQDPKKARYETSNNQPLLARVSEPSPLYPSAATTITTVENTVALAANLSRVSSPASRPPSQPPAATTPTLQRTENSSSPGENKMTEPEKSSSPGPASGYVHKLKKAWLQRHESGVEIIPAPTSTSSPGLSTRVATPPPASSTPSSSKSVNTATTTSAVKTEAKSVVRKPKVVNSIPSIPNGHREDIKDGDSSSTDSEGSTTQKTKRGSKGKRKFKKPKRGSDSNSDSDKDSDASETNTKNPGRIQSKSDSEPKKRGRKPKTKQEKEKEEGPKPKKSKEEPPQNDPLQKPPVSQLKKTGESFLQDGSCYEVAPKLPKCRECRWTAHQRNKKMPNIFCRFYAFRRLRYTKNGQLAVAGFSDPIKDVSADDLKLWVPDVDTPPDDLDVETSKFLLTHVGDQFCDLVEQEKEAMALHMGEDNVVAWKRVVQGVREMCDVCETTLFNIHWACSKCGFVVCIDCYKGRKNGTVKVWDDGGKDRDEYSWLLCASRLPHEQDKLMLTQIISGNALLDLGHKVHEVRHQWSIPQYCDCAEAKKYKDQAPQDDKKKVNGVNKDLLKNIKKESKDQLVNGTVKQEISDKTSCKDEEMSNSPLNFFADVALSSDKRESESSDSDSDSDSDDKEGNFSTLRELLIRPNAKPNGTKDENGGSTKPNKESSKKKPKLETVDDVISCVIEQSPDKDDVKDNNQVVLKHFIRKYNYGPRGREPLPIRIMTKTESSLLYPGVAHSWLCDGKLLRLLDPLAPNNTIIFQDQWKRGQPVIVSGVGQKLNLELWKPQSFTKDYGDIKNDLINCLTGNIVPNQPMKKFWDGFENYSKRLKDEKGQPMVLKLKDWPPGDDFAEMLPSRFEDLMSVLPMGEYTRRNGRLNLAGRLPECFVRPDLGPKMYIAYGSAIHPSKASTNLHLDISDAVNVMCYVGIPKDADYEEHIKEALKAIDEAGCDILTRRRVREKDEVPGALWHIYHARDADKIRDLLNKVAIERGDKLEPHHDPIHDQSWYLDGHLRDRLYKEYGVEGYAIIQCYGDAVFIPAGAPHQVRNLHNCVKVAEDFVSPENIAYCFHLTQEFRHLSDTHTNHEDKLQIKNIIYHDMKDSLACLMAASKELQRKCEVKEENEKTVKKEPES